MMTRPAAIILSLTAWLSIQVSVSAQPDTAAMNALGEKLEEYLKIIEKEPADVKCGETDFLIESCQDSLVRQYTALKLYNHFIRSRLMGDETVAIHIYDKWFGSGKVAMKSDIDMMNARIFATFNRQSLIGSRAPELTMVDIDGQYADLFRQGTCSDRPSVLFFYDSGCPTCKMDAVMLRSILSDSKYRVNLYAIYTQQSEEDWKNFVTGYLDIENPQVNIRHLWDPDLSSDFQLKYGLLQTPGIFLISRTGTVIGRKLDVIALKQLLDIYCKPYEYGNEESEAFYDRIFSEYGGSPECGQVRKICDEIADKTLSGKDTLLFKQMTGDLMYWLGNRRGEGLKCGLDYLIGKYITGKPDIWTDSDDSLKILPWAEMLSDLLGKADIGSRLPDITVSGLLKKGGREKTRTIRLDRLRNATVIFHTEGCSFCKAELEAADSLSGTDRKMKFFIIDMDLLIDSDPDTAFALFERMDLSVMPYITVVDGKGTVRRKYVSLTGKKVS